MSNKHLAAVYDFRGKQEYIYKTNRVKEIMGASEIIKNAYRNAIKAYGKEFYEEEIFSLEKFDAVSAKFAVLYEGGGNIVLLFQHRDTFLEFNNHFSFWLIENAPGLSVICGVAEFDDIGGKKFSEVTKAIFADLSKYKRFSPSVSYADVLPFTQIDPKISLPVVKKETKPKELSLSAESVKKLEAFKAIDQEDSINRYAQNLDTLVHKKGTESLIAIIYIDGNGMGKKVEQAIPEDEKFEDGVNKQRVFTKEINVAFVEKAINAIENKVGKTTEERAHDKANVFAMRQIIGGGDEITIVCNARKALDVVKTYFDSLTETNEQSGQKHLYSACAGIAVCNSHAPFSSVYEIAEQCCENGKKRIKKLKDKGDDNCYVDAFFCYNAITADLETLRLQQISDRSNMPYCVSGEDAEHDFEEFLRIGSDLKKINRTNVKALRDAAFRSRTEFELELMRVASNYKSQLSLEATDMPVVCDAAEFFDIWFGGKR